MLQHLINNVHTDYKLELIATPETYKFPFNHLMMFQCVDM